MIVHGVGSWFGVLGGWTVCFNMIVHGEGSWVRVSAW